MRKKDFDTRLLIYRSRQIVLISLVSVVTFLFSLMILKNNAAKYPWYALIGPITCLGLVFLLIPRTTEWEYKPWQAKPRRIEQQQK